MACQLVVLALVLIALAGVVFANASSTGGSPTSALARASADGSVVSSSPTSQLLLQVLVVSQKNCGKQKSNESIAAVRRMRRQGEPSPDETKGASMCPKAEDNRAPRENVKLSEKKSNPTPAKRPHYEIKMARQLVVLALVLIALTGVVSAAAPASDSKAAASSPGSSPAGAPAGASVDGNAAGSSPPSLATAPSPSGGVALEVSASTIVGVGAATVAGYVMF
ncbi:hypothetical protein Godav_024408 [Gossypium davidsonii]|uniref:Uncharacterized protein n=2 Tax=Gossypium TaxID=3633 RepID=A0A7J8TJY3_GOSDV|nr:hypothetical protein [Gossypium davidsonii]